MNIKRWIARRDTNWRRLDALVRQAEEKGLKSLKSEEIRELASLYRSVTADLARARTHEVGNTVVYNLQSLIARSYALIYQGSRRQEWEAIVNFYRWGFPAIVRHTFVYTLTATAIFMLGALIAWWYAWQDPMFINAIAPESLITMVRDEGKLWMGSIVGVEPLASSRIMTNNLSVSFGAVAGGITAGFYTTFLMVYNGIHIGGIATLVGQNNLAYPFWAFVFPHGSLELPAIFLAGGAGFLIARAILFPGGYHRAEAIKLYGSQAVQLVFGIVPMLIIAGTIEGFFSPNPMIPNPVKYLTGLLIFIGLVVYCRRKPGVG
ncbi:MAG: stage II sporulation protein M [Cyanobacteria bacterium P01_A01_bin.45]